MHEHDDDHHHRHQHHHVAFDTPEAAARTEAEGEALLGLTSTAVDALAEQCRRRGLVPARIVDLGSGPGVGSCLLAEHFPAATVVAADSSTVMLERAVARAERLGLADRVEVRLVDLPSGLADLGTADVAWVSMALHHVGDEAAALSGIRSLLAPNGLLILLEHAGQGRVVPPTVDLGRPGVWERLDDDWARWFAGMRAGLPDAKVSADYPAMIDGAGLEVLVDELLTYVEPAPLGEAARAYVASRLRSGLHQLDGVADAADLAVLARLADPDDPEGVARRADAFLEARNHVFIAARRA